MPIVSLNPYLMFNGTASKAIALYEKALGAKSADVMRFGDVPNEMKVDAKDKDRIMHSMLRIGELVLMVSDTMPDQAASGGGGVHIALHFDDVADMLRKFEALAVGALATFPPREAFWGATFGTLTDAFGVQWMFNCEKKKA